MFLRRPRAPLAFPLKAPPARVGAQVLPNGQIEALPLVDHYGLGGINSIWGGRPPVSPLAVNNGDTQQSTQCIAC